jgi:hypothetical protein
MMSTFSRRSRGFVAGHHDAEVDDLVVVAAEHHADDVLADVVDVALDGGERTLPGALCRRPARRFSSSMKGMR